MTSSPGTVDRVPTPALLAVVGAVAGWAVSRMTFAFTGAFDCGGGPVGPPPLVPSVWLVLSTAVICTGIGFLVRRHHRTAGWRLPAFGYTVAGGMLNGMVVGMVVAGPVGAIFGGFTGLLFSLPFVPPMLLMVWSTQAIGSARRGSLVDRAQRRTPWLVLATLCAVAVAFVTADHYLWALGAGAVPGILVNLVDFHTSRQLAAYQQSLRTMQPVENQIASIDLGLGDSLHAEMAAAATPFRSVDRPVVVIRGDIKAAKAAFDHAHLIDASMLLLLVVVLAAFML